MTKKNPSKPLLIGITGSRSNLLSSIHHGLADVSLNDFYPVLTLDETLAFAIGSYHDRVLSEGDIDYGRKIQTMDSKELFNYFLSNEVRPRREGKTVTPVGTVSSPYAWLKSHTDLSDTHQKQYDNMNKADQTLEERLNLVNDQALEKLKTAICNKSNEYVFEIDYKRRKGELGTNHGLQIMHFQPKYPKPAQQNAGEYAAEIARILKRYPDDLIAKKTLLDMYNDELKKVPEDVREYAEQCGIDPMHARYYDLSGMPSKEIEPSQSN